MVYWTMPQAVTKWHTIEFKKGLIWVNKRVIFEEDHIQKVTTDGDWFIIWLTALMIKLNLKSSNWYLVAV